ncbi:MAG: BON domain-containing protein [Myxococcales bacterium]|nr:BON domain-containing protein [Myxococcales bacterium]
MARRTTRARCRSSAPTPAATSVCIADLLHPVEIAELERMLDGDEDVRARMLELLAEHDFDASTFEIEVAGGRVRLLGAVDDPVTALLVEDLAWSMPQVRACDNALRIDDRRAWSQAS